MIIGRISSFPTPNATLLERFREVRQHCRREGWICLYKASPAYSGIYLLIASPASLPLLKASVSLLYANLGSVEEIFLV